MYRGNETHNTHAWMLGRLAGHFNHLQEYVVAACFVKMLARRRSELSIPYIDAINSVDNFEFKKTYMRRKTKETQMEKTFVNSLAKLARTTHLKTSVVNLTRVTSLSSEDFELYTEDMCQEFHQLLRELLEEFFSYLKKLESLKKPNKDVFLNIVRKVVCYGELLQLMAGTVAIQRHFQVIEDELSIFHHKRARELAREFKQRDETEPEKDDELESVQPSAIRDGEALTMSQAAKDWLKLMVVHFDAVKIVVAYMGEVRLTELAINIVAPPIPDKEMLPWKVLLQDAKYIDLDNKAPNFHTSEKVIDFLEKHMTCMDPDKGTSTVVEMLKTVDSLIKLKLVTVSFDAKSLEEQLSVWRVSSDHTELTKRIVGEIEKLKLMDDDGSSESEHSRRVLLYNITVSLNVGILEMQLSGLRGDMSPDQAKLTERIRSEIENLKLIDDGGSSEHSRRKLLYNIFDMLESLDRSCLFIKKLKGKALSSGQAPAGTPHCEILLTALITKAKSLPLTLTKDIRDQFSVSHIISIFLS